MTLISHYIGVPGFGLCSGMGSCGTCMIEISEKDHKVKRSTIACDIRVNEDLANKIVYVPDL
jgi:ferredoxin